MLVKTTPLGPFAGINNRLPDHQLAIPGPGGRKAGDYLRNAINVDLTNAGTLARRKGSTLAQACANGHSLWSDGSAAYYADGDTLYRYPRTSITAGLTPGRRLSFESAPDGSVIWSDGVRLERIAGGVSAPLSLPVPNPSPSVTASPGGALPAGLYQISVTAAAADGTESGATWPVQVSVPENGKIVVTGLPGTLVNLYLSAANDDKLCFLASTTATSYTISVLGVLGAQLQTVGLRPTPPGNTVRLFRGRLLVAAGTLLYYSEPFSYGLHHPLRGFLAFGEDITLVAPGQTGVYVATATHTYWLAGTDIEQSEVQAVLPYGAVPGTFTPIENSNDVAWFSTRGLVIGSQDGQVKNVQEKDVAVGAAHRGATLYRDQDGMRQFISALSGVYETVAPAATYTSAELARKENT